MESDGEKLREFILMNSRFWTWPPNEYHKVVFMGYEIAEYTQKSGQKDPCVRYFFKLGNETQKPWDNRSIIFAGIMEKFKAGDRLRMRRNKLSNGKYEYAVSKIE